MVGTSLSKDDVVESFIRSSGPGGQNVNKVATCVALLHKPSGIIIKCQQFRTQSQNREQAWKMLREALQERLAGVADKLTQSALPTSRGFASARLPTCPIGAAQAGRCGQLAGSAEAQTRRCAPLSTIFLG